MILACPIRTGQIPQTHDQQYLAALTWKSWFEMGLCQILLLRDCLTHMKMDMSMSNMSYVLQGPEHPNPGMPYTARGFPRYCYLPDNEKGRKVRHHTLIT